MPLEPTRKKWEDEKDLLGVLQGTVKPTSKTPFDAAAIEDIESRVFEWADKQTRIVLFGEDTTKARPEAVQCIWIGKGVPEHAEEGDPVFDEEAVDAALIEEALGFAPQDASTAATDTELAAEKKAREEADASEKTAREAAEATEKAAREAAVTAEEAARKTADGERVTGPVSSTSGDLPTFSGTTGKVLQDSGKSITADTTLAANSDNLVPTEKAVKAYVDALLAASDAVLYKGVKDCSANPNYPAAEAGHVYVVSVAGRIGGAAGTKVEAGDMFICKVDGTAAGTQAEVGASWNVIQTNLIGAVSGPEASTSGNIPTFNGSGGNVIQDSGKAHSTDGTFASNSDAKIPTEKAAKTYADTKLTQTTADGLYLPQIPGGLVSPMALGGVLVPESTITVTAKRLYLMRCIIPKTGKLRDLTIFVGTTSGKVIAAVYDTGDAAAEKRTRLYASGEVAVGTAEEWQTVADPNLSVTRGQEVELCVVFDNATVTFGRGRTALSAKASKLPAAFNAVSGGAQSKLWGITPLASFAAPETIKESEVEASTASPLIIARIS